MTDTPVHTTPTLHELATADLVADDGVELDAAPDLPVAAGPAVDVAGPASADNGAASRPTEALLVREGDIAGDYLERLLDIVDYDGDIDLDVEGDRAVVAVIGGELQGLIGPNGATLEALQELTRLAVQQQTGVRSRLMLDVGGYRARRRTALSDIARAAADEVVSTGTAVRLDVMNPFERKVVHDAVAAVAGVRSESEGEEPERRVVLLPDN